MIPTLTRQKWPLPEMPWPTGPSTENPIFGISEAILGRFRPQFILEFERLPENRNFIAGFPAF